MRYFTMVILFLLSITLQSTVFSHFTLAGFKPDLLLVLIVLYALMHGSKEGAIVGFLGGAIQDLAFGHYIGLNIVTKTVIGYLFGSLERKLYKDNVLIPMVAVFVGTFINETLMYIFRMINGISSGYILTGGVLLIALYNSFLVPFVYKRYLKSTQKGFLSIRER